MSIPRKLACLCTLFAVLVLGACAPGPSLSTTDSQDVAALTRAIQAMGADVDPEEAARAARLAYSHTQVLARQYEITDPPLIHNTKVNMGLRSRGLCWHWAMDMEARLKQEGFQTLSLHRAVANADNPFRLEHSTVIISRRGEGYMDGIVLDPWRLGGVLHWAPTREDTRYDWQPRDEVLARKRARNGDRSQVALLD